MSVSDAAVEAVLAILRRDDLWDLSDREEAILILEAAAPHMLAGAWDEGWYERAEYDGAQRLPEADKENPYKELSP